MTGDPYQHMRQSYDVDQWQQILNAHSIPPRRAQAKGRIPVRARIVWERDGEEQLDTVAFGWTPRLVLVEITDRRYQFRGVWLAPADVRRQIEAYGAEG